MKIQKVLHLATALLLQVTAMSGLYGGVIPDKSAHFINVILSSFIMVIMVLDKEEGVDTTDLTPPPTALTPPRAQPPASSSTQANQQADPRNAGNLSGFVHFEFLRALFLILALTFLALIFTRKPVHAASWWEDTFGTRPNLVANEIYAFNYQQALTDMESTLFVRKINGNPINVNACFVPSTYIGGISASYSLSNLPDNAVDTGLLNIFNSTVSVGYVWNSAIGKGSLVVGAKLISVTF